VNVTEFGKSGEASARVLTKGWLVAVEGRLEHQRWQTDAGENRHDYAIIGRVEHLTAPRSATREQEATQARETTQETEADQDTDAPGAPGSASRTARPPSTKRGQATREAVGAER
jgi:single-stranded DNA-binding protein